MALVSSTQHGALYKWGFNDAGAPVISKFHARSAELKYEPEVVSEATDGEGHADSVTVSKKTKRKIAATFTGYVDEDFDGSDIEEAFNWNGRYYIVTGVSDPVRKGEYAEVSVEALSRPNVTGPAA